MHAGSLKSTREASELLEAQSTENHQKSELVTGHSLLIGVLKKIMMHARATEFDRANLLAML